MSKSYKQKRSRKRLTVDDLMLKMTDAVKTMEKIILSDSYTENQKIQAVNALSGLVGKYKGLIETHEIIERIEALENNRMRKVG
ncbi:hypothetical protein [Gracilimonas mengyeensis]|uniref:Uncharacterized protein n=1 Tax=Gracilimonas mengyeensis TaxID=1302730 RepID=A0A521EJU4_9BACT|nr:hypothetical protein [Gracilimonas mengyeensis]SMO84176.1 hypothetical protein SAMN06265219_11289 [Gracilimonas mengyeensis]